MVASLKDVIIIANYVAAVDGTANSRFSYLGDLLCKNNNIELITSDFCHGSKKHRDGVKGIFDYKVTLIHEPGYKRNISLKRFVSHSAWGHNVLKYIQSRKKPDIIYCAVPSLSAAKAAAGYCKANDVAFIIDIQDLWPEAFRMVFHVPVISNLLFAPFSSIVNAVYKSADAVVAVSNTYIKRALTVDSKCQFSLPVFLGTDLIQFDKDAIENPPEFVKQDGEKWLVYCGSLAASYDLKCVVDALALVIERGKIPPKFIVIGGGEKSEEFKEYANKKNINALFTGRLPYNKLTGILCKSDFAVNPITKGSAASIINKHSDYACAGLAVINTQDSLEYRELVDKYGMGINCENGNSTEVADIIIALTENQEMCSLMCRNARHCAEQLFDRNVTYKKIVDLVETITIKR